MLQKIISTFVISFLSFSWVFAIQVPSVDNSIFTTDMSQIVDTAGINNPIRDGIYQIVDGGKDDSSNPQKIQGIIINSKIEQHQDAKNKTIGYVKTMVNYALSLISLIALIYLIYHGFLMILAAGDDTQYKKGLKGIRFAIIAIVGIGLSWIVISFVFYVINYITK